MSALLEKIQPTYGTNTRVPRRASNSQTCTQGRPKNATNNAARGTSARQPVRSAYQTQRTATTAQYTQGHSITDDLVEEHLPQTNPPGRFNKRLTGRLYPWTYKPGALAPMGQTQMQKRIDGKRLVGILVGILSIFLIIYTITFFIVLGCITAYNTLNYGPTHTAYTTAVLNGTTSTIQTSNQGGTIYVMITVNGSSQTYTGPNLNLNPDAWNRDVNSVVATAEVGKDQRITIHLLGNVNYFRPFFVRPEAKFLLVPDRQGYKVVQP